MHNNLSNQTRAFNKIEILDNGKLVKKTSTLLPKFYDEIIWFVNIKNKYKSILNFIPNVKSYSLEKKPYIIYDFIPHKTLHTFFTTTTTTTTTYWQNVKKCYKKMLVEFSKIHPKKFFKEMWEQEFSYMYIQKTIERLESLKNQKQFSFFFNDDWININNQKVPSVNKIIEYLQSIKNSIPDNSIFNSICTPSKNRVCFFHGDLCFSNVFYDRSAGHIWVIDPRASFGQNKEFGDIWFEYAKIYESIFGLYDFVIEDQFKITLINNKVNYKIIASPYIDRIQKCFDGFFPKENILQIQLIEALQFLCMIPFHSDFYNRQLIFLCHGIIRFYNIVKSEWK